MRPVRLPRLPLTLAKAREDGYRRALEHAGYLERSIDLAVKRDRFWIKHGRTK